MQVCKILAIYFNFIYFNFFIYFNVFKHSTFYGQLYEKFLRMKRAFYMKEKAFLITFERLLFGKISTKSTISKKIQALTLSCRIVVHT